MLMLHTPYLRALGNVLACTGNSLLNKKIGLFWVLSKKCRQFCRQMIKSTCYLADLNWKWQSSLVNIKLLEVLHFVFRYQSDLLSSLIVIQIQVVATWEQWLFTHQFSSKSYLKHTQTTFSNYFRLPIETVRINQNPSKKT